VLVHAPRDIEKKEIDAYLALLVAKLVINKVSAHHAETDTSSLDLKINVSLAALLDSTPIVTPEPVKNVMKHVRNALVL
jgi:hypothetical protein